MFGFGTPDTPSYNETAKRTWLFSSIVRNHLTNDESLMYECKPCNEIVQVLNKEVRAKKVGNINVQLQFNDGSLKTIKLRNVYLIPILPRNMFSVLAAGDYGYSFLMTKEKAIIKHDGQSAVIARLFEPGVGFLCTFIPYLPPNVLKARSAVELWHKRLAHASPHTLSNVCSELEVENTALFKEQLEQFDPSSCSGGCTELTSNSFLIKEKYPLADYPCQIVHSYVSGPLKDSALGDTRYLHLVVDDKTRIATVFSMKKRSGVASNLIWYVKRVESLHSHNGHKVALVCNGNEDEYFSPHLRHFLHSRNISLESSRSFRLGSQAEYVFQKLSFKAQLLLHCSRQSAYLWPEAVSTATHLYNLIPSYENGQTPYELFHGQKPVYHHLRVFGCRAELKNSDWTDTNTRGIMVGYSSTRRYKILVNGDLIESLDVTFKEDVLVNTQSAAVTGDGSSGSSVSTYDDLVNDMTYLDLETEKSRLPSWFI